MRRLIVYAVVVSALGYVLVIASAVAVLVAVRLITGYAPSFTFFLLTLVTFRLVEVHYSLLVAPPLVTFGVMIVLARTPINRRLASGVSLSAYYVLAALMYLGAGAGEFPLETSIPWIVWVFVLGLTSSIVADKVSAQRRLEAE